MVLTLASVLLGAVTGKFRFVMLAVFAIPIAVPFGFPEEAASHDPLPLWFYAFYVALYSAVLIAGAVLARLGVDWLRHRHAS